eukprot:1157217-Pelagomonas_calceolata.AAC.8
MKGVTRRVSLPHAHLLLFLACAFAALLFILGLMRTTFQARSCMRAVEPMPLRQELHPYNEARQSLHGGEMLMPSELPQGSGGSTSCWRGKEAAVVLKTT